MTTDITQSLSGLLSFNKDTQNPFGQLSRVYDKHERTAIDLFKNDYMEAKSPAARKLVCQLKVFPGLFNYWESIGEVIDEAQKVLRSKVR
jgi:hypothetical protein